MLARLRDWLDHRTGYRRVIEALLIEHIPGGAKWRYVWGSCLAFVFSVQLITGLLLMTAYSPGDSTAWGSVYFIQYEMDFGWLIRGLHHFGSQTMVVLLGVHMLQVVIAGAHLPPREVNWWLGLALLGCVLGLSLTGYLLPWDQKGYWATQVATNIAAELPVIGPSLSKIIVGGPTYGHHTLTRFFALHVGILPPLVIVLMIAHVAVFRRHGVTTPSNAKGEGWFWPDQAFRDMLVSIGVFGIMLALTLGLFGKHGHRLDAPAATSGGEANADPSHPSLWNRVAHAGRWGFGANLDAPADAASDYPARPEWYFLFLFQLLKYFEGKLEIVGTVIIPAGAALFLFALPLLGYTRSRWIGRVVGVAVVVALLVSIGSLTYLAVKADTPDPNAPSLDAAQIANLPEAEKLRAERNQKAKDFHDKLDEAEKLAGRAIELAAQGIPADGAVNLLRGDPKTQGPKLFAENCAGCHRYSGEFDAGKSASDLKGYATEDRIRRLLADPSHDDFFGLTELKDGEMVQWVRDELRAMSPDEQQEVELIVKWLAKHPRSSSKDRDSEEFQRALQAFEAIGCIDCHNWEERRGSGRYAGPDLTGYGDARYLRLMMMAPDHAQRYGSRNRMPLFRDLEGPDAEVTRLDWSRTQKYLLALVQSDDPDADEKRARIAQATKLTHLSDFDRELIIRWLIGDHRVVFGGDPATAPPVR